MKIIRLDVSNVKRIKAITIEPTSAVVTITGKNGQGKTSALDSLAYVLGGEKLVPKNPLRNGEDEGFTEATTDDGISMKRFFSRQADGGIRSWLEIRNADGSKFSAPQRKLSEWASRDSFDPLMFLRLEPKKQAEVIRKVSGLDLGTFDRKREELYKTRTGKNHTVEILRGQLAGLGKPSGKERVDISALASKLAALQVKESAVDQLDKKLARAKADVVAAKREVGVAQDFVAQFEKQLSEWKANLKTREAALATKRRDEVDIEAEIAGAPIFGPDIDELKQQLAEAGALNAEVAKDEQRTMVTEQLKAVSKESDHLTDAIDRVDKEKAEALASTKLPVPGLGFTDDGVTLNGFALEEASAAEQLRLSAAIGFAINPTLKVLLIRAGNDLDSEGMALVTKMAEEQDGQVWIERVCDGDAESGVLIEDGEVVAVDGKPKGKRKSLEVVK